MNGIEISNNISYMFIHVPYLNKWGKSQYGHFKLEEMDQSINNNLFMFLFGQIIFIKNCWYNFHRN